MIRRQFQPTHAVAFRDEIYHSIVLRSQTSNGVDALKPNSFFGFVDRQVMLRLAIGLIGFPHDLSIEAGHLRDHYGQITYGNLHVAAKINGIRFDVSFGSENNASTASSKLRNSYVGDPSRQITISLPPVYSASTHFRMSAGIT